VGCFSLQENKRAPQFPFATCRLLAREKINLPFLTCGRLDQEAALFVVVEFSDIPRAHTLLSHHFGHVRRVASQGAILSIFPHKSNPEIAGIIFELLGKKELKPDALAWSQSALSLVLQEEQASQVANALFEPFRFSAYRTPEDWKLAQKGKEQLHKEVVASYQEKRPRVYALEWLSDLDLIRITLEKGDFGGMGMVLKEMARMGLELGFMISVPLEETTRTTFFMGLPKAPRMSHLALFETFLPGSPITESLSVAVFTMNGPHFGDRYGIAGGLLGALDEARVSLLALSCSVASVAGVVPARQRDAATRAVQKCFDVPTVTHKSIRGGGKTSDENPQAHT
jgi:aspartokinase